MSLSDVEACVSFRGDLTARPRGAARALSWGLDLADFEAVPIKLTGFEVENAVMLWSVFMRCVTVVPVSVRILLVFPAMHARTAQ